MQAILIVIFASMIHTGALVFLIFIALDIVVKKYDWKVYLLLGVGVTTIFIFYNWMYSYLTKYFFSVYTSKEKSVNVKSGNLKMLLIYTAIFALIVYLNYNNRCKKIKPTRRLNSITNELRLENLLTTAIVFALAIQLVSINNAMIARFAGFFSIYFTILIPNTLEKISNKWIKNQYLTLFFIIAFLYMIISLRFSENGFGHDGVIPYVVAKI